MYSRLLQNFLAVVDCHNITSAAEALNVSQSALTKSIQKLETDMGTLLFYRGPKGVILTKEGEILAHHARIMENEFRHANTRIAESANKKQGLLRIGAGPVWLINILPSVIAEFQKTFPDVRVSLESGVMDTLVPSLISGDLDLICVALDFPIRSELIQIPLFNVEHVVVVDPSNPLAHKVGVKAKELADQNWLTLKSDNSGTDRISAFFASNGMAPPKISLETTSIYSLLETLRKGNYIAHIPKQLMGLAESKGLQKVNLRGTLWQISAGLAMRHVAKPSSALSYFLEIIKARGKDFSDTL